MGVIFRRGALAALLLILSTQVIYAAWSGPQTIVSGKFGDKSQDFGLIKGEIKDEFPDVFEVFDDGKILIIDSANDNSKLFLNDNNLLKTLPYLGLVVKEATNVSVFSFQWNENIQGDKDEQIGFFNVENNIWEWVDKDKYWLFAVSSGLREFELAGNEVRHGNQVVGIAIASCLGFGRLDEAVDPFQEAVGQA